MIVIDLEFTSLDPVKGAILSIGAVDMLNPERIFYKEYRAHEGAEIITESIQIAGFTKEQVLDKSKPTFEQAIQEFIDWMNKAQSQIMGAQNPVLDLRYLHLGFNRANIEWPWGHRSVDLHAVVFAKIWSETGKQPLREDGHSDMDLDKIAKYAGFNFERAPVHNALTDAKMTAECFSRILFKRSLFKEFE